MKAKSEISKNAWREATMKKIGLDTIALVLGIIAILFTVGMIIYAVFQ